MGTEQILLSKEETEVYDRQIRLWGVEAQQKLRNSKVLVVGLTSLGNEVCKNIVLAGISHLTIIDHTTVTDIDQQQQLLLSSNSIGNNKALSCLQSLKKLNPNVDIVVDQDHINNKTRDFFVRFNVVCMLGCCVEALVTVNELCHDMGVKFICGDVFGFYSYMFSDLGTHNFLRELPKQQTKSKNGPIPSKSRKIENDSEFLMEEQSFCTLSDALIHPIFEKKSLKEAKRISKAYLVMQVLHHYHEQYGEYPIELKTREEFDKLQSVRDEAFERLGVDNSFLDDELLSHSVGFIYPVNAILGGVIAQEIIKIVSEKDEPHHNFFFYDGIETSGVVEYIGPDSQSEEKSRDKKHEEIVL